MVTSVNSSLLAALKAQEQALASRLNDPQTQGQTTTADNAASPAADPAVIYTGSDGAPSLAGVLSTKDSLNRAASIADVGINAGQTIAGLLNLVREKVAAAQAGGGDTTSLNNDYQELLGTIDQLAKSASFLGVNMLDGSSDSDLTFKADVAGDSTLSLTPQDFTVGGPVLSLAGTDLTGSSDDLASLLTQVNAAGGALSTQLSQMSAQSDQIQGHLGVLGQLAGALGSGSAGQPDLDADSARLMALQIQQALSDQSQNVANQSPQALLSLFRTTA